MESLAATGIQSGAVRVAKTHAGSGHKRGHGRGPWSCFVESSPQILMPNCCLQLTADGRMRRGALRASTALCTSRRS